MGQLKGKDAAFSEPGFYDGYKCGQKDAYALNREYEELRAIIDNGSESMTHEDAVRELKRLMAEDEVRAKAEPVGWMTKDGRITTESKHYGKSVPEHFGDHWCIPLFTHPASAVPEITEIEIRDLIYGHAHPTKGWHAAFLDGSEVDAVCRKILLKLRTHTAHPAPAVPEEVEPAHRDHPLRHFDRTCPACNPAVPEDGPCKQHQFVTTFGGDFCIKCNEPAPSNEHPAPAAPSYDAEKLAACQESLADYMKVVGWIQEQANNGQIQIAQSTLKRGYEIALISIDKPTSVNVYIGGLGDAVFAAMAEETK